MIPAHDSNGMGTAIYSCISFFYLTSDLQEFLLMTSIIMAWALSLISRHLWTLLLEYLTITSNAACLK